MKIEDHFKPVKLEPKDEPTGPSAVKQKATPAKQEATPVKLESSNASTSTIPAAVDLKRVQVLRDSASDGAVVYWMSRDQRHQDNWALLYAQEKAISAKAPLYVVFCLATKFPGANLRSYDFLWRGLQEVSGGLRAHGIPLHLLWGGPEQVLPKFVTSHQVALVVADFSPLRIARQWKSDVQTALPKGVGLHVVDAHNIVPCWLASDKQEVGARTIRSVLILAASHLCNSLPHLKSFLLRERRGRPKPDNSKVIQRALFRSHHQFGHLPPLLVCPMRLSEAGRIYGRKVLYVTSQPKPMSSTHKNN